MSFQATNVAPFSHLGIEIHNEIVKSWIFHVQNNDEILLLSSFAQQFVRAKLFVSLLEKRLRKNAQNLCIFTHSTRISLSRSL